jgi:hypothetical protein
MVTLVAIGLYCHGCIGWRRKMRAMKSLSSIMDDDDDIALYAAMMKEEEGSSRRHQCQSDPTKVIHPRDHLASGVRINDDYFVDNPVYTDLMFRRRFVIKLV